MSMQPTVITIPNVKLDLDQLIAAIRQTDEQTRIQIARVLAETQMDAKLARLIDQLAQTTLANNVTAADIEAEIKSSTSLS